MNSRPKQGAWHGVDAGYFMLLSQPESPPLAVALIVLPPGPEQSRTYRLLRELSQQLVSAGYAVLRLELTGTGNSARTLAETRLTDWYRDITCAWDFLEQQFPTLPQRALGVRYGARLLQEEARLTQRQPALTALCPVLSGADWLADLRAITRQMENAEQILDATDLAGTQWPEALIEELETQTDRPLNCDCTILENDSRYLEIIDNYQLLEKISSNLWIAEDLPLISSRSLLQTTCAAMSATLRTATDQTPAGQPPALIASPASKLPLPGLPACWKAEPVFLPHQATLAATGTPAHLFGLYTKGASACPPVLILNSGLVPQFGPYRLHAQLSAALAQTGITSFRLDESGKGESARKALNRQQALQDDFAQTLDWLGTQGHHEVIIAGICSGADAALELAAQDERVVGLITMDGFAPKTPGFYARYLHERLVSGRRVWGFIRRQLDNATGNRMADAVLDTGLDIRHWEPPATMTERYRQVLSRGVPTCAVFTGALRHDYYNGPNQLGDALGRPENLHEIWFPEMSHLYPASSQREKLIGTLIAWLAHRWLPATE